MTAMKHTMVSIRLFQVRALSRVCLALAKVSPGRLLVQSLGSSELLERLLVGHRAGFKSRQAAESYIARYGSHGHADPEILRQNTLDGKWARPSDYPVLFHLGRLLPELSKIVDIGGSVGNVFYRYAKYLPFSLDLSWVVYEIEATVRAGEQLARERGETRLFFSSDLESCQPADLVLISGSLHYLEALPPELLRSWKAKPRHIIVNRSPVTIEASIYGIQDTGRWLLPAKVIQRDELVSAMESAGYQLVDEWPALELHMRFPLQPRHSVHAYSGFLFTQRVPG